jgi:C4-type Zn-finger protein
MTWLEREVGADRVECDVCGRSALSLHDRHRRLPPGWRGTMVRGRHVCGRCLVALLPRLAASRFT